MWNNTRTPARRRFVFTGAMLLSALSLPLSSRGASAEEPKEPPIIPRPARMEVRDGFFTLPASPVVLCDTDEALQIGQRALKWLHELGIGAKVVSKESASATPDDALIDLNLDKQLKRLGPEGYLLNISSKRVVLTASQPAGLFYGLQTLRQLLLQDAKRLPCMQIEDTPRFTWRGIMLDNSRHFVTKEQVKRLIDLMGLFKMNRLHWHLSEDQAWRVQIDRYPKLTEVAAWRPNITAWDNAIPNDRGERYGGFFTKDDVREIVRYAEDRHVLVVPEIEMPGHCFASLRAYPELSCVGDPAKFDRLGKAWIYRDVYCAGNDKVFEFIDDVFTELCELFPSPWIHIGGDECPKDRWKACPKCQARIKEEGLKDEHELQSYFVKRVSKILESKGRRLIGWDEILEGGLAPGATVQAWRNVAHGITAANAGHDVVMSPTAHCYFDYTYKKTPVEKTYAFNPVVKGLKADCADHVLGVEGCMWLGAVSTRFYRKHGKPLTAAGIDYQLFPRAIALAEVGWTPQEARKWHEFQTRLKRLEPMLKRLDVSFGRCPTVWPDK